MNRTTWLLTGGNGFVGSNLKNKLQNLFPNIDILSPSSKELDLRDFNETLKFLEKSKVEVVIHLAANMAGIGELTERPLKYFEDNVLINFNIIRTCLMTKVNKFLTLGSTCGFSRSTPIPMKEEHFWCGKPENTYGTAKLLLLEHLMSQSKMEWLYLVPANIYGEGDHFDELRSHVIPATILKFENAKSEKKSYINVWGDGSQVRDFIYIDDLTSIICEFLKLNKWEERIVNVSTGKGTSIKEIVFHIRKYMELEDIKINWLLDKPTGLPIKVIDNGKLSNIIKNYKFITIEEGLKSTIEWFNNKQNM
jgi:GDP-L-fucose synthase